MNRQGSIYDLFNEEVSDPKWSLRIETPTLRETRHINGHRCSEFIRRLRNNRERNMSITESGAILPLTLRLRLQYLPIDQIPEMTDHVEQYCRDLLYTMQEKWQNVGFRIYSMTNSGNIPYNDKLKNIDISMFDFQIRTSIFLSSVDLSRLADELMKSFSSKGFIVATTKDVVCLNTELHVYDDNIPVECSPVDNRIPTLILEMGVKDVQTVAASRSASLEVEASAPDTLRKIDKYIPGMRFLLENVATYRLTENKWNGIVEHCMASVCFVEKNGRRIGVTGNDMRNLWKWLYTYHKLDLPREFNWEYTTLEKMTGYTSATLAQFLCEDNEQLYLHYLAILVAQIDGLFSGKPADLTYEAIAHLLSIMMENRVMFTKISEKTLKCYLWSEINYCWSETTDEKADILARIRDVFSRGELFHKIVGVADIVVETRRKYYSGVDANLQSNFITAMGNIKSKIDGDYSSRCIDRMKSYLILDKRRAASIVNTRNNLFVFNGGVIHCRKEGCFVRPGLPEDYLTQRACVTISPDIIEQGWDHPTVKEVNRWITDMYLEGGAATKEFILRVLSLSMWKNNWLRGYLILNGIGSNSKTSFANLIMSVFDDYCIPVPTDFYATEQKSENASPLHLKVTNSKVSIVYEISSSKALNTSKMKTQTGSDFSMSRDLYNGFVKGKSDGLKMILSNGDIKLTEIDQAIGDRLFVVNMTSQWFLPQAEQYHLLPDDIQGQRELKKFRGTAEFGNKICEFAGAFLWILITYYNQYAGQPLEVPEYVRRCTKDYWSRVNIYVTFVLDSLSKTNSTDDVIDLNSLYAAFTNWYITKKHIGKTPSNSDFSRSIRLFFPASIAVEENDIYLAGYKFRETSLYQY
jgi:hypothetical protein